MSEHRKTPKELAMMSAGQRGMYRKALAWNLLREAMNQGKVEMPLTQIFLDEIDKCARDKMAWKQ